MGKEFQKSRDWMRPVREGWGCGVCVHGAPYVAILAVEPPSYAFESFLNLLITALPTF